MDVCDGALSTTSDVVPDEPPKLESPEYVPVIESVPAGAPAELHEPVPPDNVATQSVVDPVEKVTEPVGVVAVPTGVTVAEKVTGVPTVVGLGLAPIAVCEEFPTTSVVVPVDAEKLLSPEYAPETVSLPPGAAIEVHEPWPPDKVAVQSAVDPVVNVTDPVGVGSPATVDDTVVE
jgi:hypothetical protein